MQSNAHTVVHCKSNRMNRLVVDHAFLGVIHGFSIMLVSPRNATAENVGRAADTFHCNHTCLRIKNGSFDGLIVGTSLSAYVVSVPESSRPPFDEIVEAFREWGGILKRLGISTRLRDDGEGIVLPLSRERCSRLHPPSP